ncbi:putative amidoligase enzyme [Nitzschia inconspicua]|uniref:Amidoligase enzyme n=1 Tax=Nitzschia inconspicua TaxID=303405 RepID=A0A9K3Q5K1_9STRA|nr:putative amidoligase enzyme [Nitzschia inconspicua]
MWCFKKSLHLFSKTPVFWKRGFGSALPTRTPKNNHVNILVGNTIAKIPPSQARLARTGQKKVFDYTLYAKIVGGNQNAIRKVEFFPDFVDDTYLPRSYIKESGPVFETRHDCWGMSTAKLLVTMKDGAVKTLYKRLKSRNLVDRKVRLVYKSHNRQPDRAFGVELEMISPVRPGIMRDALNKVIPPKRAIVTGWSNKTTKAWKVGVDNSINAPPDKFGMEVVSPILRGEEGIDYLRKVSQQLGSVGAYSDVSCGLHVHIDLHGINFNGQKRICQAWLNYEAVFDELIAPDRRGSKNIFCLSTRENPAFQSLSNHSAHELIENQTTLKGLVSVFNRSNDNRNRYFKLNLQNLVRSHNNRNTIEFRGHEGTTDAKEIEMWVRLVTRFVEAAANPQRSIAPFENGDGNGTVENLLRFVEADVAMKKYFGQ